MALHPLAAKTSTNIIRVTPSHPTSHLGDGRAGLDNCLTL